LKLSYFNQPNVETILNLRYSGLRLYCSFYLLANITLQVHIRGLN